MIKGEEELEEMRHERREMQVLNKPQFFSNDHCSSRVQVPQSVSSGIVHQVSFVKPYLKHANKSNSSKCRSAAPARGWLRDTLARSDHRCFARATRRS